MALALAIFLLVCTAVAILLARAALFEWAPLNWLVDLLGGLAVLGVSWLVYPAVVTIAMGFFLDRIADAVEALHFWKTARRGAHRWPRRSRRPSG